MKRTAKLLVLALSLIVMVCALALVASAAATYPTNGKGTSTAPLEGRCVADSNVSSFYTLNGGDPLYTEVADSENVELEVTGEVLSVDYLYVRVEHVSTYMPYATIDFSPSVSTELTGHARSTVSTSIGGITTDRLVTDVQFSPSHTPDILYNHPYYGKEDPLMDFTDVEGDDDESDDLT